jgi:hypothetical protein
MAETSTEERVHPVSWPKAVVSCVLILALVGSCTLLQRPCVDGQPRIIAYLVGMQEVCPPR